MNARLQGLMQITDRLFVEYVFVVELFAAINNPQVFNKGLHQFVT
jgi:hypothetical protein